jgi:hypothetical protein
MPEQTSDEISALVKGFLPLSYEKPEWRWWRWVIQVSDDLIAFVAEDQASWERLCRETTLFSRIAPKMPVLVPSLVASDEQRRAQLRKKVPGYTSSSIEALVFTTPEHLSAKERYHPSLAITEPGKRLAVDLGRSIAALHTAILAEEALEIGFPKRNSLDVLDAVDTELSPHKEAEKIRVALPGIRRWFAALPPDLAFCHRDIQAYNFTIDQKTGALLGLFDIEDAGVDHRAEDLKYLPSYGMTFTSLALEVYNQAAKTKVTMEEVGYFHILSALEHFLFISRERPRWPGIVDWSLAAIEKFSR